MSRVIFFEKPRANIDVSIAEPFGELYYLFDDCYRRCSVFDTDIFQATVIKELRNINYDPDEDYICVAGSMLTIAIGLVAVARVYKDFKVLLFSSTEVAYVERVFKERLGHEKEQCKATKIG